MSYNNLSFAKLNHIFFLKARELSNVDIAQARMLLNLSTEEAERLGSLDIEDMGPYLQYLSFLDAQLLQ